MNGVVCEAVGGIYHLLSYVFSSFEGVCESAIEQAPTVVIRGVSAVAENDPTSWLPF